MSARDRLRKAEERFDEARTELLELSARIGPGETPTEADTEALFVAAETYVAAKRRLKSAQDIARWIDGLGSKEHQNG